MKNRNQLVVLHNVAVTYHERPSRIIGLEPLSWEAYLLDVQCMLAFADSEKNPNETKPLGETKVTDLEGNTISKWDLLGPVTNINDPNFTGIW